MVSEGQKHEDLQVDIRNHLAVEVHGLASTLGGGAWRPMSQPVFPSGTTTRRFSIQWGAEASALSGAIRALGTNMSAQDGSHALCPGRRPFGVRRFSRVSRPCFSSVGYGRFGTWMQEPGISGWLHGDLPREGMKRIALWTG